MCKPNHLSELANILTAIGTIFVAILAIWGEFFRSIIFGPKLKIVPTNIDGLVVPFTDGTRGIMYHMKVINEKSFLSKNCRVMLTKIWKKNLNGDYLEQKMSVPLTFVWSPAIFTPPYINIKKEHVFDFGRLDEKGNCFLPVLLSYTTDFSGYLKKGDIFCYGLEIVSDDFVSKKPQVFEVSWDGVWSDHIDQMKGHLAIREKPNFKPIEVS